MVFEAVVGEGCWRLGVVVGGVGDLGVVGGGIVVGEFDRVERETYCAKLKSGTILSPMPATGTAGATAEESPMDLL